MKNYIENLNPVIQEYFNILSPEGIPDFIFKYIDTPEMKRIGKIGMACGTNYTKLYRHKFFYNNLEHSIGVALIIWKFTKDKKQTLAGLFHDIATPVFKHCIDFMNNDHEKQESTEALTTEIIKNSEGIIRLLNRDNIKIEEIDNYHIYPIADNDTPKLSADRLEYTFSNGLYFDSLELYNLNEIKEIYNDIKILKNEENEKELGFKTIEIAEKFIEKTVKLWPFWREERNSVAMQFIADIVKKCFEIGEINQKDLYSLSEEQIINKINNSEDVHIYECFKKFQEAEKYYSSNEIIKNKYCIEVKNKYRYIVPLVKYDNKNERINNVSEKSKEIINNYLKYKPKKYASLDIKL